MTLTLAERAARAGLDESYYDFRGQHKVFSDTARQAILDAMGFAQSDDEHTTPGVWVCTEDQLQIELPWQHATQAALQITTESKDTVKETVTLHGDSVAQLSCATIQTRLPCGYHVLHIDTGSRRYQGVLIVAPTRSYEPVSMQQDQRCWGLSIQLYTLRSAHNMGVGDFADLQALIRQSAPLGCATIGLNPLHALRPANPAHISPYSPSHREFLNVWYIAPQLAPEYQSAAVQQRIDTYQQQLMQLRTSPHVDYPRMATLKCAVYDLLFAALPGFAERRQAFKRWTTAQGEPLFFHALYDALDEHFQSRPECRWGWRSWPAEYHDVKGNAVQRFAQQHATRIEFFQYLQWLAATQLEDCQQLAREQGMTLGLYGDVAVGVDANGSEVWCNQSLYVEGVGVGAPPDPLALKGQDWGIPPQHPLRLTGQQYQPFIRMLRANMCSAGALRIDHVMTLCRLWWVPRGFEATEGVYVHYPLDDLMKIVALESVRNRCLVIGEDLGTVPDAMRDAMHRFQLYHYKVLFFEKTRDGEFIAPADYVPNALAVVTTHDLPPFKSWWQGDDIELRKTLNQYPDTATLERVLLERDADRRLLMRALNRTGLWHWQDHQDVPTWSFALMRAAYLYAGLSRSRLLVIQPEDLQGMIEPVNVPGTSTEHPNWQRKLHEDLQMTLHRPEVVEMLSAMNRARQGEFPNQY